MIFNVRMRAAKGGRHEQGGTHVSGAERLVTRNELTETIQHLTERALNHENGMADFINLSVNMVHEEMIESLEALPLRSVETDAVFAGREAAYQLLREAGISHVSAQTAIELLATGPGPNQQVLRGAVLLDAESALRREPDRARGVRVSGIDWKASVRDEWCARMTKHGLARPRIWEAIALASKVTAHPDVVAELCWSDDPGYITGYVAAKSLGYVRISPLKTVGEARGGRVFFVRPGASIDTLIRQLETTISWIDRLPSIVQQ